MKEKTKEMAGDSGTCCSMCGAGFWDQQNALSGAGAETCNRGGYRGHGGDSY